MRRAGFSMISLLVILAIVAFGMALALSFVSQIRRASDRTMSMNNMRQIALAVHNYHDVNRGLPPLIGVGNGIRATAHFHVLPYIEQEPLYRKGRENPGSIRDTFVPTYVDPGDPSARRGFVFRDWLATTNYPGNWLMFRDGGVTLGNIPDGTSNTAMFGQRYQLCNDQPTGWAYDRVHYWAPMIGFYSRARFQAAPKAEECDPALSQSMERGSVLVGLGDGSVRSIADRCSPLTWSHVLDPADGNPLGDDFN